MRNIVKTQIKKENLITAGEIVLVGVSGGADSVCLLDILHHLSKEIGFTLMAVHVNHMLRGEMADADEEYVKKICKERDIELKCYHVDVNKEASKRKVSTEEAGRILRYEIFNSFDVDKIAVAHHMNDQAETVLHHIFRGSSIKGIGGINFRQGKIIRPLLSVSRAQIEEYLNKNNISYCIDQTNLENDYTRNKIRNVVIPYISDNFNNNIVTGLCDLSEDAKETYDYVHLMAENVYKEVANEECVNGNYKVKICKKSLTNNHNVIIREVLMMALQKVSGAQKDITRSHVESLKSLLMGPVSRSVNLPYMVMATSGYDYISICKCENIASSRKDGRKDTVEDTKNIPLEIDFLKKMSYGNYEIEAQILDYEQNWEKISNDYTKVFDYDKIKDTVVLRNRMSGDYIVLDEAGHKKSIKEYFINEKISAKDRNNVLLLCDGNHIMWIIGHRISAFYKADKTTKRILKVTVRRK